MDTVLLADVPVGAGSPCVFCDVGLASECGAFGANEDYCVALSKDDGASVTVAVADGIGSQPHGRALSRLACLASISSVAKGNTVPQAFGAAASEVRSFMRDARSPRSGTTLILAKAIKDRLDLGWEGDGACLVVGHDGCREMIRPHREGPTNRITRFLGRDVTCRPETANVRLRPGDTVVVLTDGVADVLGRGKIVETIRTKRTAGDCARRLVKEARATGRDDATAAIIRMR